ncbi:F-box only protein 43 [Gouania willdenowi]|uniref:ZBR-type domain-containing protein n=1 Tax=Gouania willdenowi TaxID=441366 RepID=A0A8C5GFR3_GOUWI|nr:F-box only protein 43 [Gouania willdenowi]XP_028327074.1 F-box only protein 43 [Gouania willdenowi]
MQYTPESNVYQERCKGLCLFEDCTDSGYSGVFQSPYVNVSGRAFAPVEFDGTPKEKTPTSVRGSGSPKGKNRGPVRLLDKEPRMQQKESTVCWCETPKVYRKDAFLRHKLLMSKFNTDVLNVKGRPQCSKETKISDSVSSEHWLSASFESLDIVKESVASDGLKMDQDLQQSSRKRRILFTQMRTSTLNDGNLNSNNKPSSERKITLDEFERDSGPEAQKIDSPTYQPVWNKENSPSPVNGSDSLCTPSSLQTPTFIRSVCEDSGFSSLEKSQDSSVDHDGSFQELLCSSSKGSYDTPTQIEAKHKSRLQRQHRLSTLKEGGSQSEEDSSVQKNPQPSQQSSHLKEDEVFAEHAAPGSIFFVGSIVDQVPDSLASAKEKFTTPLRASTTTGENATPYSKGSFNADVTPPLRATPGDLSLTPALQLVHVLSQQKAQMFAGQSPSLKEQLKCTAVLTRTPVTFRTTMPLAGLIGRKMGFGKLDILTELKKRSLRHILSTILALLDPKSVCRCAQVCKTWNKMVQQDGQANLRRRNYLREAEAAFETGAAVHVIDAETRGTLRPRSALKIVQPFSRTSSYCTPQSGKSSLTPLANRTSHSGNRSKSDKFIEVAKTLFSDECLKPCPRCEHPARCRPVKREGVCSRTDCGFQFCTSCLCSFHSSKECGSRSIGRRNDILIPGSAESKRNVRRL